MSNNQPTPQEDNKPYKVITYIDDIAFNYTLPDEEEVRSIEHEVTLIWEESLESFFEKHGKDKPYKINEFRRESDKNYFIHKIEGITEGLIDEVQEEIANKMKFGFEFSGQLHNDD